VRIGLFGGTFDPPHVGHLIVATDAVEALELDRLVFVPTAQQPLKAAGGSSPAADRLAMVRLMVDGDHRFDVDAIEIERGGLSFTVDTLEALAARCATDTRFLVMGADAAATFAKWRAPRRIAELARLAIVRRSADSADVETAALVGAVRAITGDDLPAPVVLDMRRIDISSTELRERERSGRSLRGFVPDAVGRYVAEHGLYK
jgi:nicotinate-nucleotide adenylyltransferase